MAADTTGAFAGQGQDTGGVDGGAPGAQLAYALFGPVGGQGFEAVLVAAPGFVGQPDFNLGLDGSSDTTDYTPNSFVVESVVSASAPEEPTIITDLFLALPFVGLAFRNYIRQRRMR